MRRLTTLILLCVLGACGSSEVRHEEAADPTSGLEAAIPTTTTTTAPPPPPTTVAPHVVAPKASRGGGHTTVTTAKPHGAPAPVSGDIWHALAMCETGGKMDNPNTGNGYYGYFQFSKSTWHSVGGQGVASDYDYETQKSFAIKLKDQSGWGQWPYCSHKLGLR